MFAAKQLEDLAKKLCSALPSGIKSIEIEMQQQFKDILQSAFDHMDLVTREEFDIQVKVLARTREKVDLLQSQLNALLNQNNASD
ncbi:MAG: accessory factor UbiK family protein [Legionellaceae bacterium]|nr:accessory factor UbiK family protein [Legionellaceae bacterium]